MDHGRSYKCILQHLTFIKVRPTLFSSLIHPLSTAKAYIESLFLTKPLARLSRLCILAVGSDRSQITAVNSQANIRDKDLDKSQYDCQDPGSRLWVLCFRYAAA
jgi:hypothetical protein